MNSKLLAVVLIGIGIVLLVVFAAADVIGVGGAPGFGWKQISGSVAGLILLSVGIFRMRSDR